MTGVRWIGPGLLERHGRVRVVRSLAVISVAGLTLFCFGPNVELAIAGAHAVGRRARARVPGRDERRGG